MSEKKGGRQSRPTFTDQEALLFHSQGRPGKLEVIATKPMATQRDLSLAYSPGVAVPVLAIADDESLAYDYTVKGNFVAVITNGTAILGLGNRGALAVRIDRVGVRRSACPCPLGVPDRLAAIAEAVHHGPCRRQSRKCRPGDLRLSSVG